MAPRKFMRKSLPSTSKKSKDGFFTKCYAEFNTRVRRRESLRQLRSSAIKLYDVTSEAVDDMNSCFPPLAALSLHGSPPKPSAPASRIEVLQDLDLYYIKQIAHNLKLFKGVKMNKVEHNPFSRRRGDSWFRTFRDPRVKKQDVWTDYMIYNTIRHPLRELDLEQKIEVEIKMREGTTKLLAACKHQAQSLEAAKSLLTSNERMSAYMAELQRRKRQQIPKGVNVHPKSCLSRGRSPNRRSSPSTSLEFTDDPIDTSLTRSESISCPNRQIPNSTVKPLYLKCPLPSSTLRFVDKSPDFYVVTSDYSLPSGGTYQYQDVCYGQPMRIRPIGCKARLCLSDLRMPLIWRDTDHFKNKGDYRRFAVFCLAKVGTEMFDTSLLCPVDRSLTDLTFPDILVFNQVPSDFTFTLEVYSHMLRDDMSIASTRRKIKNTIHTSISRTVGKKLAASLRDELNSGKIGPHFELMASARLTLDEVSDSVRTHDLKLEHTDIRNGDALPLFGHFCCRLAAQPECMTRDVVSSSLVNGYASLQAFNLCLWRDRQHWLQGSQPVAQAAVDRDTVIKCTKNGNDLIIVNEIEGKEESLTLKLMSPEDREMWLTHLTEHIKDNERWKGAAEKIMEIYTPGAAKNSFQKTYRQGSLYDETPLIDTNNENAEYTRPTVQDIFGLTPSTSLSSCSSSSSPTFRERSLSSGGSNKSRTRSHWPFSRNNHD